MKTVQSAFWGLSAAEMAALTDDEMRGICKLALMEAGVLDPVEPVLLPTEPPALETEVRYVPTHKGYNSLSIAFTTEEAAAKFVALVPLQIDKDWRTNTESAKPLEGLAFECRLMPTPSSVAMRRASLETATANASANDSAKRAYEKAREQADKILDGLLDARNKAAERVRHMDAVRATFASYCTLAEGNETVARGFLGKVYSADDISEAIGALPTVAATA